MRVAGAAALGLYLLFIVLVLVLRYVLMPNIDAYRPQIEAFAGQALKTRVTMGPMTADWQGVRPRLLLTDVRVLDKNGATGLFLPHTEAVLSWSSLLTAEVRLHRLEIDNANLDIRRAPNGILSVGGIEVNTTATTQGGGVTDWLLDQRRIVIRGGTLTWTDLSRRAAPVVFNQAALVFDRFGIRHHFAIAATPPSALAAPLDVRGYFDRSLFSGEANSDGWTGELYLKVAFVDLAAAGSYLDLPIQLTRGRGALRAWLKFASLQQRDGRLSRLPQLVADVRLADVATRADGDVPGMAWAALGGRLSLIQGVKTDVLRLTDVQMQGTNGESINHTNLEGRRNFNPKGEIIGGSLKADRLALDDLSTLARQLPVAQDLRDRLARLAPRGTLAHLTYQWSGALEHPSRFQIDSRFAALAINGAAAPPGDADPGDGTVGFGNLSGSVSASEAGGHVSIDCSDALIDAPAFFEQRLVPAQRLAGQVNWQILGADVRVTLAHLTLHNADLQASLEGTYLHGPHSGSRGPGSVDLVGQLSLLDVHQLARYLPLQIGADARSYLARALVLGSTDNGHFEVRGPLEKFPFREHNDPAAKAVATSTVPQDTRFRIETRLHGVTFDYAPAPGPSNGAAPSDAAKRLVEVNPAPRVGALWPVVSHAEGSLVLDRDRLEVDVKSARIQDAEVVKMAVAVTDVGDRRAAVKLDADIQGATQNYVQFVNASPLAAWLGHLTDRTRATGEAQMHLALLLPLASLEKTSVNGRLSLAGDDINLFDWLPPLETVKGDLVFTENSLNAKGLAARFLGGDVKMDALTSADRVLELRASGTVAAESLAHVPEFPLIERLAPYLSGSTGYRLAVNLPAFGASEATALSHGPRMSIESSLNGMAVSLPAPLEKSAASTMPLAISLMAGREASKTHDQIDVHVGGVFNVSLSRDADAAGVMQITHIAYGLNAPAQLGALRAVANLNAATLDADAWRSALTTITEAGTASNPAATEADRHAPPSPLLPELIVAHIDNLKLIGRHFGKLALNASKNTEQWQITLSSNEVAGKIQWRDTAGTGDAQQNRITARLDRLFIPASVDAEVKQLLEPSDTPAQLPALDIIAEDFQLRDLKLGRLELLAANVTGDGRREWRMDKLNLSNPDATLAAKGTWGKTAGSRHDETHMSLTLQSRNLGGMFERLTLGGTVSGGTADVTGEMSWNGSPLELDSKTLSGHLNLSVGKGQFLKVDPGFGKLLGVLSLQSMQRRLTFDFSDLFSSGFAFDAITAQVDIQEGVASSEDFVMNGPSAVVQLKGSANLAAETQDLRVKVLPQFNLGTGSLAYAFINPAIGLGTLAFQELFRPALSNAFAYEYNVTGPWTDPTIVKEGDGPSPPSHAPAEGLAKPPTGSANRLATPGASTPEVTP